ncbi:hypothetical protein W97_00197 [Coniosporium apollinis CBS 100218]|uniref:Histidine kinase n=1 Tax=Coniosporium apollinis (strain CBS 100218) TaxID=1168221 RepID=R7YGF9_CONA1|nr:uncharacterized protein W97_00197 [Coniosporium apollinis CBS 100218]EON60987.1 hypothetical protein W97_00197 [Coniosporium apollinis CBS 100218]
MRNDVYETSIASVGDSEEDAAPDGSSASYPSIDGRRTASPAMSERSASTFFSRNDPIDALRRRPSSLNPLDNFGLIEVLELDSKPTLIFDLTASNSAGVLQPAYCNPALLASGDLLETVTGKKDITVPGAYSLRSYSRFRKWILEKQLDSIEGATESFSYSGMLWVETLFRERWKIISGIRNGQILETADGCESPVPEQLHIDKHRTSGAGVKDQTTRYEPAAVTHAAPTSASRLLAAASGMTSVSYPFPMGGFDMTAENPPPDLPPFYHLIREFDWAATPVGDMRNWSSQLRVMCNIIMRDPNPAVMFWTDQCIMIYNEAYVPVLGDMHPGCLGTPADVALGEIWTHFIPIIEANKRGEAYEEFDLPLFLNRHGFLEETYFSFRFVPVLDDSGTVVGHYEPITETTRQKVSERRLSTLLSLSEQTAKARDMDAFWMLLLRTLESNDKDIPFALLYSVEDIDDSNDASSVSTQSSISPRQCILKGAIGVPDDHPAAPARLDLQEGYNGFLPYFRVAMKSKKPTVFRIDDGTIPDYLTKDISWRGFGDKCSSLVISPIMPTTSENILGFLILGLNPRRPFDDDYQQFIQVGSRLCATTIASVVLLQEEMEKREKMLNRAALIQEQLNEQLTISQKESRFQEQRFQRFAERADVAIFIAATDGTFKYRNHKWFDIFKIAKDEPDVRKAWTELVSPEDMAFCDRVFGSLVMGKTAVSFELRMKMLWQPPIIPEATTSKQEHHVWILCSAYPELSEDGEVIEILGCVTDISRQKWGEGMQKQRTEDALESKRQLENFIDTTSHEMRNPLSAVIQCADGIITSHGSMIATDTDIEQAYRNLLETSIDAAQTILQCSQHMKRIVDDVLTMSKLDSGLLVFTPIDARPEAVGRHAVKMFEAEARAADVKMRFEIEDSYYQLGIDCVSLDPTRLLQILINLITNAIKFTRLEAKRSIVVSIGASLTEPDFSAQGVPYIRTATAAVDRTLMADWAAGENVYLQYSVQDTGRGLSASEKELLFARFSQASPRTHVQYGGSGLGLFISRRLTEMQGGAIGFLSQERAGSTFAFYVRARRKIASPVEARRGSIVQSDFQPSAGGQAPVAPLLKRMASEHPGLLANSGLPAAKEARPLREVPSTLHVLVVEDNLVNQRVLAKQLRNLGCVVNVANHGGEALDFLRKTTHWTASGGGNEVLSLILMDWEMPIMDGLTCVRIIRGLQQDGTVSGHVPVIAVTANVREQQISAAMDAGMDDVVSKPFRVPDLLVRMRNLISNLPP